MFCVVKTNSADNDNLAICFSLLPILQNLFSGKDQQQQQQQPNYSPSNVTTSNEDSLRCFVRVVTVNRSAAASPSEWKKVE